MADINKYLESQLALAKLKCENKSRKLNVSLKSKAAADQISKKQFQNVHAEESCSNKNIPNNKRPLTRVKSDLLYYDEGNINDQSFSLPSTSRYKQNVNKIIDDGDKKLYEKRLKKWRKNMAVASSENMEGKPLSADIQYLINGNNNPEEIHKLQNGLCVPKYIWKELYKFQRAGVKWLYSLHEMNSGGLLGDEMGLGKTIQIIAFLSGLYYTKSDSWGGLGPSMIVAPATVIYQWVSHFHYWFPRLRVAVLHHTGSHAGQHKKLITDIHDSRGMLLVTYAGIVKYRKDLISKNWHYLILDEGHKIRNPDSQASQIVKKFKTPHKLVITGSPMQNSLQELWSLFDFMRPGLLGTYNVFMQQFAVPITQGGYANATAFQQATAIELAKTLKDIITPSILRRTKAEVQKHIKIPEKNEQVLFCALSQEQKDLYQGYLMSDTVKNILNKTNKYGDPLRARVLVALSTLRKICNHPDLYLDEAEDDCNTNVKFGHWERSGKMIVVNSLLKMWQQQGYRALIFSQSRAMLHILEQYLQSQDMKYLKMDGMVNVSHRQNMIKTFNANVEYLVFLSTTRVGGLGVNLTGANRVIIYDPDWNPATDDQAKERAWRIGQKRNVTVYRLLSAGTIEEKTYQRQIFKHFLGKKILINPNQKNVLTTHTLQGLFTFEMAVESERDTETASLFKHTKVNVDKYSKAENNLLHSNSTKSNPKLMAMRNRSKKISKMISNNLRKIEGNRGERVFQEVAIETFLDKNGMSNISENATAISEIINTSQKNDIEQKCITISENQDRKNIIIGDAPNKSIEIHYEGFNKNQNNECRSNEPINEEIKGNTANNKTTRHSKRKIISGSELESNLPSLKKAKKKKHNRTEKNGNCDDDFVLGRLFAKSTVKNALHHDVVIGFTEKEKQHRIKEEAAKKARDAVRALETSSKKLLRST